ncbi:MAG: hypothetical protein FJ096_12920 [Deltaproteobacteria bacterium]|nr:hypothetical protein [Deltaproteobacteria bacterium]
MTDVRSAPRGALSGLTFGLAVLLLPGCNYAIERDWESLAKLGNGEYNRLAAYTDGTADATIYATTNATPGTWTKFYFEGTWQEADDEFVFDFQCKKGPCGEDDFDMRCDIIDEEINQTLKLDCFANGKWKNYPFNWQEVL